jgi:7-carboxy-7-deazaguanine synthase (Cx14CxxC type)
MAYSVKELFFTLQGEGARAGRPAVFCRFAGCNLWSGRETDRVSAACSFCDTDFVGTDGEGGGRFADAGCLGARIEEVWCLETSAREQRLPVRFEADRYVVFTGGEPLLQLDEALIDACHARGFEVAVETNGTFPVPDSIDWITVSPKPDSTLVQRSGQELKLVYPHAVEPETVAWLDFREFYLQPLDGPDALANTERALAYCRAHPPWKLSLQTHKLIGIR